jgi:uridine kinase
MRRPATFVREDPAGGGPAAALVTGLRCALRTPVDAIVVFPADAPLGGRAALILLQHLADRPDVGAVVGSDAEGREQPLQLALRPEAAAALVRAAGPTAGSGASARRLLHTLEPPAVPHRLDAVEVFDIDTSGQQQTWQLRSSAAVQTLLAAVAATAPKSGPLVVALDGRSGTGKSSLAAALALETEAGLVHGDDFYSPVLAQSSPEERAKLTDAEVADSVFDWRRLRTVVLEPLVDRRPAIFRPYDWERNDGSLGAVQQVEPGGLVVLEGVYSARPELADLVDLAVQVEADPAVRWARLAGRPDDPAWTQFWDRGEDYYFRVVRPAEGFDLRVSGQ